MSLKFTNYAQQQMLQDASKVAGSMTENGFIYGAKLGLFTGAPAINSDTTLDAVTDVSVLPTYGGYAVEALVFNAAAKREDGSLCINCDSVVFQPTDSSAASDVTGYYIADSGQDNLIGADLLRDSDGAAITVNLANNLEALTILAQFAFAGQDSGNATVIAS